MSDKTVAARREALESTAEIPQLPVTKGKDGRKRKAKRKARKAAKPEAAEPASPAITNDADAAALPVVTDETVTSLVSLIIEARNRIVECGRTTRITGDSKARLTEELLQLTAAIRVWKA